MTPPADGPAAADRLLALLMSPRVRRVRRWSFILTLPLAAALAATVG